MLTKMEKDLQSLIVNRMGHSDLLSWMRLKVENILKILDEGAKSENVIQASKDLPKIKELIRTLWLDEIAPREVMELQDLISIVDEKILSLMAI